MTDKMIEHIVENEIVKRNQIGLSLEKKRRK